MNLIHSRRVLTAFDLLYDLALALFLSWAFLHSTMFPQTLYDEFYTLPVLQTLLWQLPLILGWTALIEQFFAGRHPGALLLGCLTLAAGFLYYQCWFGTIGNGHMLIYPATLMIAAGVGRSFKGIARTALLTLSGWFLATVICSQNGVLPDLVFHGADHSLGFIYPTDCAARLLFLLLLILCLRGGQIGVGGFGVLILAAGLMQFLCGSATSFGCLLLLILGTAVHRSGAFGRLSEGVQNIFLLVASFIYPLLAILFLLLVCFARPVVYFLRYSLRVPSTFTSRIWLARKAFDNYPLTLSGAHLPIVGYGGSTTLPKNYFFLDNSFVDLLMEYGILLFVALMVLMTVVQIRLLERHLYYQMFLICVTAVSFFMEAHMMDLSYNVFLLMALGSLDSLVPHVPLARAQEEEEEPEEETDTEETHAAPDEYWEE